MPYWDCLARSTGDSKNMSRRVITAIVLIVIIINLSGLKYFNSVLVRRGTSRDQDKQNLLYNMNYDTDNNITVFVTSSVNQSGATKLEPADNGNVTSFLPVIYMITPTYARLTQKADLLRLCFTLMHVPKLHWIVVEDSDYLTMLVKQLLSGEYSCKIPRITHLNVRTQKDMRIMKEEERNTTRRGGQQRNIAIQWLRDGAKQGLLEDQNSSTDVKGVVYFGDDDNTYDVQVFEEMRWTRRLSMFPVGLAGLLKFEGPECANKKITGFIAGWGWWRKFPVDMAGFAVNLHHLLSVSKAKFDTSPNVTNIENTILVHLASSRYDVECLANNKVYVWHTRTEAYSIRGNEKEFAKGIYPAMEV